MSNEPIQPKTANLSNAKNVFLLKLLMQVWTIKSRDVIRAFEQAGYSISRAYLSRLLNDKGFEGSATFWRRFNTVLPALLRPEILYQSFQVDKSLPENPAEVLETLEARREICKVG